TYARRTAETVRDVLPWATAAFLATYATVAIFELWIHPDRLTVYVGAYLAGAVWCALVIGLTRAPSASPSRILLATTLLGIGLIANTTIYHVLAHGEAEVLALGNLYLMIGFLAAFPSGVWPQLAVALAACVGLTVGMLTTVHASVNS